MKTRRGVRQSRAASRGASWTGMLDSGGRVQPIDFASRFLQKGMST